MFILEKDPKPEENSSRKELRFPYSQPMYNVHFCKDNNVCSQDMFNQNKQVDCLWKKKLYMLFYINYLTKLIWAPKVKWLKEVLTCPTSGYLNGRIQVPF